MTLWPFWRYYGGKWRGALAYPAPEHGTIVEPFAGAAGYALRYPDRRVILIERYHVVAEIWRYLITASEEDVREIPLVDDVGDLPFWVPQPACWLVGFAMNAAIARPRTSISNGALALRARGRRFYGWTAELRDRVASQLAAIRHWEIIEGDYRDAGDIEATWFIDPPYQGAGSHYVHGPSGIDYDHLSTWCRTRRGQPIVCEAAGATWLPFRTIGDVKSGPRSRLSAEAVWP